VADIILINDSFAALPPAFLEGQRIINGMQDILRLFLTRAMIVALLILSLSVVGVGFPFVPTHVSLLTLLTVGVPTLALAAWARPAKMKRGLLRSVISFVFPAAISVFGFGILLYTFYFIQVSTNVMTIEVQPEDIAAFQEMAKIDYELPTQREYAVEVAGVISRTVLTTFTVLTGLILVIFVEPPHPFFAGGDELSPDKRPTYLAFGLLLVFVGVMIITPVRNFFELILLGWDDYLIIAGVVLIWMLVLRRAYQHRWFPRFLNLDT
jgi:cation-transporting ATPase E